MERKKKDMYVHRNGEKQKTEHKKKEKETDIKRKKEIDFCTHKWREGKDRT
jgi:hypothetical protein